jgi:very-short-patch-repair endonuclease
MSVTIELSMYYGANSDTFKKAKELRKSETAAEKIVWSKLCNHQLNGFSFRRQHPIHRFIVDFYCHQIKLVVEIDGDIHTLTKNKEYDIERSAIMEHYGITVVRFSNNQVLNDIDQVLNSITETAQKLVRTQKVPL